MKKRSTSSKIKVQSKSLSNNHQSNHKHSSAHLNNKKPKKQQIQTQYSQDFIILNGKTIQIKTPKEKNKIQQYIYQMKRQNFKEIQKKENQIKIHKQTHSHSQDIQTIIRSLSKSQKLKTLKSLQKQFQLSNQKKNEEHYLSLLDGKLQKVKIQLQFKLKAQTQNIFQSFNLGQINETSKQQKIKILNQIKNQRIKMIQNTRNLFAKIINQQNQNKNKQYSNSDQNIQQLIRSFNSFSQFDAFEQQKQQEDKRWINKQIKNQNEHKIEKHRQFSFGGNFNFVKQKQQKAHSVECQTFFQQSNQQFNFKNEIIDLKNKKQNFQLYNTNSIRNQLNNQFQEKQQKNDKYQIQQLKKIKRQADKIKIAEPNGSKQTQDFIPTINISKKINEQKKQEDIIKNNIYEQDQNKQLKKSIKIPTLLTKDRIEQIQHQNKIKQLQIFKQKMERRIAIQLSCLQQQNQNTFTTLADVNSYIVNLYQFLTSLYSNHIVNALNTPYGKSVLDKLYYLRMAGTDFQDQYNNVLEDQYYNIHQRQIILTMNKQQQYQKIHCKAVFQAFNSGLNAYRPYFQIDGQVYPWTVSQKGITFYQINQDNIEEVFEKTKIKILQYCSSLCGLLPSKKQNQQNQELSKEQFQILKIKRQQLDKKCFQSQIREDFKIWDLKIINYETICRLIVSQSIFNEQIFRAVQELDKVN